MDSFSVCYFTGIVMSDTTLHNIRTPNNCKYWCRAGLVSFFVFLGSMTDSTAVVLSAQDCMYCFDNF